MDVKEKDMEEVRLSLKQIMKKDMEEELLHGIKVCNLAFHFGRRLGLTKERWIWQLPDCFMIWGNFRCPDICMDEKKAL